MSTDPVRVAQDLTWWPDDGTFSMSRRLWTRPRPGDSWVLEDMATSGSPLSRGEAVIRWEAASVTSLRYFLQLVENLGPFD